DFVGELALEAVVGFDVHFAPAEAAAALQLGELFLHDFAKMASLAGIHDHFAEQGHGRKSSKADTDFPSLSIRMATFYCRYRADTARIQIGYRGKTQGTILRW